MGETGGRLRGNGGCMARRKVGLKAKFAVLFVAMAVALLMGNGFWRDSVQHSQVEREMLEAARMLAVEMDAVWDFLEINQGQFVRNADGTYNVYCVVAAKVVAQKFTNNSGGVVIHYTNIETRKPTDAPDDYELEALYALRDDPGLGAYYGLVETEDGQAFRYVEPLWMAESCLECHGGPEGELDVMGYPKEGKAEGDLAGAVSIIIPADTYLAARRKVPRARRWCSSPSSRAVASGLLRRFPAGHAPARQARGSCGQAGAPRVRRGRARRWTGRRGGGSGALLRFHGPRAEGALRASGIRGGGAHRADSGIQPRTERQRRELESMNRILQQDNLLKEDFLAKMSHEIRTPLTSILAFVDLWEQTNTPRDEGEGKIMSEMKLSSQILLSMVNNILDLTRVEAGRAEVVLGPVDVADLLGWRATA